MSLGRIAYTTHPGRKRRRNEDSYVSDPPLFAVADGMGGAQAGALASRLAAGALREREPGGPEGDGDGTTEAWVVSLIREANRRVYERASTDEEATGMGTTMTAAVVESDRVVIGHVGDSRAYLVRNGKLEQVTNDHSLVAELVRSGKLSPEEADSHPQRSVITRALGPDPDVDVDTFSVPVEPGDLFLLCSDGLTSMIGTDVIADVLEANRDDLQGAADALVQAANEAGGEDNITVICFEIAAPGAEPTAAAPPAPAPDLEEDEDTLDELSEVPVASITTIRPAPSVEELERRAHPAEPPAPPRRRRSRLPLVLLAILVLALLALAALWGISRAHFVGAEKDGHVAVYQGLPYDITSGIHLYRAVYVSPVLAAQLTRSERQRVFDHDLGNLTSKSSAMATVRQLEQQLGQ